MKASRFFRSAVALLGAGVLALTACGGGISDTGSTGGASGPASAGPKAEGGVVIRYSTQHTENTPMSRAIARWADMIAEQTEGRVTVDIYLSAQLLPAADLLPGIMDGRADTGYVVDTMFPDLLPLTNSSSIPFDRMNGVAQAKAYHEVYNTNADYKAEFEKLGVHVLHFYPMGQTIIGSATEIASLNDLQGKNLRCLGYICDALKGVGANPVAIASNEIYEAMDRDTIDGWSGYPYMDVPATQLQEVTPFMTDPGIGQYVQAVMPINQKTWDSISAEDQATIEKLSSEDLYDMMAEEENLVEKETCTATNAAGVKLSNMSEADVTSWKDMVYDDIYTKWVDLAGTKTDVDPDAFYQDILAKYETQLAATDFESLYDACAAGEIS